MRKIEIICNRCGKEITENSAYAIGLPTMSTDTIRNGNSGLQVLGVFKYRNLDLVQQDLCKQCMEELVDWMNKEKE